MTTEIIHVWHCDHAACDATAPERTEGWTNAIYTHGCPAHGEVIAAHKAALDDVTRGRGRSEKTTWYLRCACGWQPGRGWATYTSRGLEDEHLQYVRTVSAQRSSSGAPKGDDHG